MPSKGAAAFAAAAAIWSAPAVAAGDPAQTASIVSEAQIDLAAGLHKPATLHVDKLTVSGGWAFLYADMREPDGQRPLDYQGTPFAEAAGHGGKSAVYAGLLREDVGAWRVVDRAIGPTDLAWGGWAHEHGAPAAIFQTPDE